MRDMKSSNGGTLSSIGWTQIVQLPVFRQVRKISQPYTKKNYGNPKMCSPCYAKSKNK